MYRAINIKKPPLTKNSPRSNSEISKNIKNSPHSNSEIWKNIKKPLPKIEIAREARKKKIWGFLVFYSAKTLKNDQKWTTKKVDLLKPPLSQFENLRKILKTPLKHLKKIGRFGP